MSRGATRSLVSFRVTLAAAASLLAIAAGALGDEQIRADVENILPELEEKGWRIADATRRIWEGERDWHALAAD